MQRGRSSAERHWLGMAARGAISSARFTFNQPRTIPRNLLINKYFSADNLRVCIFIHPLHQGIAGAGARVTQELKSDMGADGHTSHLPPGFCRPALDDWPHGHAVRFGPDLKPKEQPHLGAIADPKSTQGVVIW